ncbi:MAG: hypothetical protein H7177_08725 [Rhizobacter sp.]|nr:hypothetical protein [Bacteriovorax sp.]
MKFLILFTLLSASVNLYAKRIAPPVVEPLVVSDDEFSVVTTTTECKTPKSLCGMTGLLVSRKISTDTLNWKIELYTQAFNPKMETDVQSVFPKSLKQVNEAVVEVTDEKGTDYKVDMITGSLILPLKSVVYPSKKTSSPKTKKR